MAKARKPFISRKKRKEMTEARQRRESFFAAQHQKSDELDATATGEKRTVHLPVNATVGEFAQILELPVTRVIQQLMKSGIMAGVTQRIDFDTMAIVADELGFTAETQSETPQANAEPLLELEPIELGENAVTRAPIVTVMGHVDHGKTSLLDYIRSASVAKGEHGGITQHIGAYQTQVEYEGESRMVTFLDTPGHEAFTALRSHGAQVTDIVILVVAADDGVKPQTIEALNHARSAHVPIIVAITKIDLPGANIDRVKQQLVEQSLVPEEWGGDTPMVGVSSVTGEGVQSLLEYVILTADVKGYRADPKAPSQGVVIESHQEVGLGPVATFLIQNGALQIGDVVVTGKTYGKIRSMMDYRGNRVKTAGPAMPVKIAGLQELPEFGDAFTQVKSEKEARELVLKAQAAQPAQRSISDISQAIAEGRMDNLKIVLKGDAQGSLEALRHAINKLEAPGVKPLVVHGGVGDVTLTDIQLAAASEAVVLGFQVTVSQPIKKAAQNLGVTVRTYKIIYEMLDEIESILKGLVKVEKIRVERGRLKVKKLFRTTREMQILGGEITQGIAIMPSFITVQRDGEVVGQGKLLSLQKGPESVRELEAGQECGLSLETNTKVQEGDVIIFSIEEEVVAADLPRE